MEYKGPLYGKIAGKHFLLRKTSDDWNKLKSNLSQATKKNLANERFLYDIHSDLSLQGDQRKIMDKIEVHLGVSDTGKGEA